MKRVVVLISIIALMLCMTIITVNADDIPTATATATLVGNSIPVAGEKFIIEINMEEISSNLFVSGEVDFHYPTDVVTPVIYTRTEPTAVARAVQMIGGVTNRFSSIEYTGKFSTISKIDLDTGEGAVAVYIDINAEEQTAEVLTDGEFTMFGLSFMLNEGHTYDDFYFSIDASAAFLTADKQIVSRHRNGKIEMEGIGEVENILENDLTDSSGYLLMTLEQMNVTNTDLSVDINLLYNDEYNEGVLIKNKKFTADVSMTNTGSKNAEVVCYIAEYNSDNALIGFTRSNTFTVLPESMVTENIEYSFTDDAVKAKVFCWKNGILMPISNEIILTSEMTDYYADKYSEANALDINKQICGEINVGNDVDIVKINTTETGKYIVKFSADNTASYVLVDLQNNVINTAAVDNNYAMCNLQGNSTYYLKMTGSTGDSYRIKPMTAESVVRNIGSEGYLNDLYDYEVYEFVPETTGEYIVTAVGTEGVKATLYSSSFQKISSSNVGDDYVSFRITCDMTANEKYYIVVEQKNNETVPSSYELYVEEPFEIISIY